MGSPWRPAVAHSLQLTLSHGLAGIHHLHAWLCVFNALSLAEPMSACWSTALSSEAVQASSSDVGALLQIENVTDCLVDNSTIAPIYSLLDSYAPNLIATSNTGISSVFTKYGSCEAWCHAAAEAQHCSPCGPLAAG